MLALAKEEVAAAADKAVEMEAVNCNNIVADQDYLFETMTAQFAGPAADERDVMDGMDVRLFSNSIIMDAISSMSSSRSVMSSDMMTSMSRSSWSNRPVDSESNRLQCKNERLQVENAQLLGKNKQRGEHCSLRLFGTACSRSAGEHGRL